MPSTTSGLKPQVGSLTGGPQQAAAPVPEPRFSAADPAASGDATPPKADEVIGQVLSLALEDLAPNPRNERDEDLAVDADTVELAESMKLLGQLQPAIVVPRDLYLDQWPDETIQAPWVLMIGNRRAAAARLNGAATLECIPRRPADVGALSHIPIHENLHRKGINPLRMAYWLREQVKEHGSQHAVAKLVGKSQPWVNQLLKLLDLIPQLQAVLAAGQITASAGRSLAKLSEASQLRVWNAYEALPAEGRDTFWDNRPWADKSFINAGQKPVDERSRPARPVFVLRVMERSPRDIVAGLRDQLNVEELTNLRSELDDVLAQMRSDGSSP
uniref:ParB/RepB/Spo0J family partition protein n=1 Tax=Actinokineospora sp. CA-119265 TaxID=3239890 RepID=UPI003F493C33